MRLALRERGYIVGQNIAVEYLYAEGRFDRLPERPRLSWCVARLISSSSGNRAISAAKNATKTIPIVMIGQGIDPIVAGFVESLDHPGGNVTGITNLSPELVGKRLELLKESIPKLTRVVVLYDPAAPAGVRSVKDDLPDAACALKLTIQPLEVRGAGDFDKVFAAMGKHHPDGIYVFEVH